MNAFKLNIQLHVHTSLSLCFIVVILERIFSADSSMALSLKRKRKIKKECMERLPLLVTLLYTVLPITLSVLEIYQQLITDGICNRISGKQNFMYTYSIW